jgi:hypothetical protein
VTLALDPRSGRCGRLGESLANVITRRVATSAVAAGNQPASGRRTGPTALPVPARACAYWLKKRREGV